MKREIDIPLGTNLEGAVNMLLEAKAKGESVYCVFNGHRLDSDTVTMDSAYLEVIGQTKEEWDKERARMREIYEKAQKERETKEAEQRLVNVNKYTEQGKKIIFKERHAAWEECVYARCTGEYDGFEVKCALEIMEAIENGATMEQAAQILENQAHSGVTYSMVKRIVFTFSSKGPEFYVATAKKELPDDVKKILEEKKQENIKLANANKPKR